jgi:hypothetical protein
VAKRAYGTGRLFVKHGAWYGSWRTADGRRVTRKIGAGAQREAESALREMMRGDRVALEASARRRARHPVAEPPPGSRGVYLILADRTGLVKIGHTGASSWQGCLAALQRASPVRLSLHRFVPVSYPPEWLEAALHRQFAGERHHGGWFAAAVLAEIDRRSDADIFAWLHATGAWAARTPNGLQF